MSDTPQDRRYTATHEWMRIDDDDVAVVGISDFAQDQLGDIVYVELPEIGTEVERGGEIAVVESVKAASDIYAPVAGSIVAVNEQLEDNPQLVNEDPYEEGWFFAIRVVNREALEDLLEAADYDDICANEAG